MNKLREADVIFKWSNCCRLCLSQESTIDLFSEASITQHFPSKIRTCLNFLIYSGDPMPSKICAACCLKLDNWCQFRKECMQTEKDLRRRLEPYKRISYVKEYLDKYVKYEKSSEDGSISLESMSEYDENEILDNDIDEDEVETFSDSIQREDDNSELSDSDKVVLSKPTHFDKKQNCQKVTSKFHVTIDTANTYLEKEKRIASEKIGKCSNSQWQSTIKEQATEKYANIPSGLKDDKVVEAAVTLCSKMIIPKEKQDDSPAYSAVISETKDTSSIGQNSKSCLQCGMNFENEKHFAVHSCGVLDSGAESDDNENFSINPLSFVDTSLAEPISKDVSQKDSSDPNNPDHVYKIPEIEMEKFPITQWKCLVCNQYFKSVTNLKEHYNSSLSECSKVNSALECEYCKKKFTKNELVEHLVVHLESNSGKNSDFVKCNKCDDQFPDENQLQNHLVNHDGENVTEIDSGHVCSKCDQTFYDRELFEKHELVHNQQDIYNSIVTPQFTTFEGLDNLEDVTEDSEQIDGNGDKKQNVVRCFRCGRIFGSAEELEQHEFLKHKNPTPYFCRKCDLRFSARSQLLMHVRSHMRKSSSINASNTGGNTSDNTCAICGAKFFLPSDLQSHLKMHKYTPTEDSLLSLPQKSWQTQDSYDDNKIDLFARFKCSVCSKIFVHSGSIIRHGKNLHKGQVVYPLRLKRPIFLMKRARSLTMPTEKNTKNLQVAKLNSSNTAGMNANSNVQQQQDDNFEIEQIQESKWEQDPEGLKIDPSLDYGTEKCPFCEKVFKPTYLPRHIKRNHRGEVLDPQMLGKEIPDDSLVCRYCLKSCSNPHNRRVHESIHYPVKIQCNQCKICGQKFFNKASYEIHIGSCKSVRCVQCNKIFFRYLSLKNHSCIVTLPNEDKS